MAHSCPNCEQACYCDGEDVWLDSNADDCIHACEPEREDDFEPVESPRKTYKYTCFGKTYIVHIRQGFYAGGRLALELIDDRLAGPVAKITVNLPEAELSEGEILVKTWTENEPMTAFLVANGIAEDTGCRVWTGHAEAWVMKLAEGFDARQL